MVGRAYQVMISHLVSALKDASLDITTTEYLILRVVYSKEGLQQCEIAEMVGKDKVAVCRCVVGLEAGMKENEVKEVLESDRYDDEVRFDEREAMMREVHGVPYIMFNGDFAVPGALLNSGVIYSRDYGCNQDISPWFYRNVARRTASYDSGLKGE
ncbi:MAG: DsbA family protein [Muribaculaceae bacterium]|nr:DsbA family protein [Muribaculaceae bacterium]